MAVHAKDYASAQKASDAAATASAALQKLLEAAGAATGSVTATDSIDAADKPVGNAASSAAGKVSTAGKNAIAAGKNAIAAVRDGVRDGTRGSPAGTLSVETGSILGIPTATLYYCDGCFCSNSMIYTDMPE